VELFLNVYECKSYDISTILQLLQRNSTTPNYFEYRSKIIHRVIISYDNRSRFTHENKRSLNVNSVLKINIIFHFFIS
jgi:hypothetical protein